MGALIALVIYPSPYSFFAISSCIHQYYCFDPFFDRNNYLVLLLVRVLYARRSAPRCESPLAWHWYTPLAVLTVYDTQTHDEHEVLYIVPSSAHSRADSEEPVSWEREASSSIYW